MVGPNADPEIIAPASSERSAVLLPCEPDQFRDFIAGLLGKPQVIGRRISGPFDLEARDVENLYHLVDQRISSQNDASLIQFTVRIVYDDKSSVLLNSFADFIAYKEVRPLVSTSVHLSWTYLIKFRNKTVPEKQQIDISCFADRQKSTLDAEFDITEFALKRQVRFAYGNFVLRISHTDRTWGTDIEALLTGHLQTLVRADSKLRQFVRIHSGWTGFFGAIIFFFSTLYLGWQRYNDLKESAIASARTILTNDVISLDQIAKTTTATLRFVIDNPIESYNGWALFAAVILAILSVFFGAILAEFAGSTKPRFVVLTSKASEVRRLE